VLYRSGDTGIVTVAYGMEDLLYFTSDAIYVIAGLTYKLNNLGGLKQIGGIMTLLELFPLTGIPISAAKLLANAGRSARSAQNSFNFASGGGAGAGDTTRINASKAAAAEKAARKRQLEILAAQKQQLKVTKQQTQLQKAGTLFDIEGAGIIAALKGKISDEERTRLQLQLALLTGNEAAASKLAGEVARSQGLTESLVKYYQGLPSAKNPFSGWLTTLLEAQELAALIAAGNYKKVPLSIAGGNDSGVFSPAVQQMITSNNVSARADAAGNVNVYVAGSVVSEADLVEAVSNGLLNRSLSGSPSAIGRLKGSFAG